MAVAALLAVAGAGVAAGQSGGAGAQQALLAKGSAGPQVAAVQRALGLPAGAVTGRFDTRTEREVRAFQTRHGLLVDGIVGPQTRAALGLGEPARPQPAGGAAGGAAGTASGALERIAQCESGGNPRAIGGGGLYRGKYQFTYESWRAVGGSGDPAAAPEAEQDRRAALLYGRSGGSSWPSCG
jgi:peptidoglycan hydrolase-like protein with peptidoglycan-binding domain